MSLFDPYVLNQGKIDPLQQNDNRSWKVSSPSTNLVEVSHVKEFGRIDGISEDELIKSMITSVTRAAEAYLGRSLITQTITMVMDVWPYKVVQGNRYERIDLPLPPLISITSINTIDEAGVKTPYSASNYFIDTIAEPGVLNIKSGVTPPINYTRNQSGYEIIYTAGYGTAASDVPQGIQDGVKLWALTYYEKRVMGGEPPPDAKRLLFPYKMLRI